MITYLKGHPQVSSNLLQTPKKIRLKEVKTDTSLELDIEKAIRELHKNI